LSLALVCEHYGFSLFSHWICKICHWYAINSSLFNSLLSFFSTCFSQFSCKIDVMCVCMCMYTQTYILSKSLICS
jgi:hypothetical protein